MLKIFWIIWLHQKLRIIYNEQTCIIFVSSIMCENDHKATIYYTFCFNPKPLFGDMTVHKKVIVQQKLYKAVSLYYYITWVNV